MSPQGFQGLSANLPQPNKEGSEGFTEIGKLRPRKVPRVTQLVKGEIAYLSTAWSVQSEESRWNPGWLPSAYYLTAWSWFPPLQYGARSRSRVPGPHCQGSQLHHVTVVWSWAGDLPSLCLGFLICNAGMVPVPMVHTAQWLSQTYVGRKKPNPKGHSAWFIIFGIQKRANCLMSVGFPCGVLKMFWN